MKSDPYSEDLALLLAETESDFTKEILADGQISRLEYVESYDRFVACMIDAGYNNYSVSDEDSMGYLGVSFFSESGGEASPEQEAADFYCQSLYLETVGIYVDMEQNPFKEDWNELTVACFKRNEIVDASYTIEDYKRTLTGIRYHEDGTSETTAPTEKLPFVEGDPVGEQCVNFPRADLD